MSQTLPRTLFVGKGATPLTWYRCALPAMSLGCDWVGVAGEPSNLIVLTGNVSQEALDIGSYDVVIVELVAGPAWAKAIRGWRERGVVVLYEIDDWLRGIRKLEHHSHKDAFNKAAIERFELCMRAADGVICSTQWLADRYRKVNPRTWVCRNGIDLLRYAYERPERPADAPVTIGWAGGTGHLAGARPWIFEAAAVMEQRPATRFVSVGAPFGVTFANRFGADRGLALPFMPLEVYPAAMTRFDFALAPAGQGGFFKGKSDLRWLEASALGIPTVADPDVYPDIEHGVTGFHAATPAEAREAMFALVDDAELRQRVGTAALEYVTEHRRAEVAAQQWARVLREVAGERATGVAA